MTLLRVRYNVSPYRLITDGRSELLECFYEGIMNHFQIITLKREMWGHGISSCNVWNRNRKFPQSIDFIEKNIYEFEKWVISTNVASKMYSVYIFNFHCFHLCAIEIVLPESPLQHVYVTFSNTIYSSLKLFNYLMENFLTELFSESDV